MHSCIQRQLHRGQWVALQLFVELSDRRQVKSFSCSHVHYKEYFRAIIFDKQPLPDLEDLIPPCLVASRLAKLVDLIT